MVKWMVLFVVFLLGMEGTMLWCMLNFLGSCADGELAKQLCRLLDNLPPGLAIAADSAFNSSDMSMKIIRPLKSDESDRYANSVSVLQLVAMIKKHRLALTIW